MKSLIELASYSFFLSVALANVVHAADEPFTEEFLGSPLLVLVAVIIIAASASLYHRMRR
jgi:hypothetical protein